MRAVQGEGNGLAELPVRRVADRRHGGQAIEGAAQDDHDEARIAAARWSAGEARHEGSRAHRAPARRPAGRGEREKRDGRGHDQRLWNSGERKAIDTACAFVSAREIACSVSGDRREPGVSAAKRRGSVRPGVLVGDDQAGDIDPRRQLFGRIPRHRRCRESRWDSDGSPQRLPHGVEGAAMMALELRPLAAGPQERDEILERRADLDEAGTTRRLGSDEGQIDRRQIAACFRVGGGQAGDQLGWRRIGDKMPGELCRRCVPRRGGMAREFAQGGAALTDAFIRIADTEERLGAGLVRGAIESEGSGCAQPAFGAHDRPSGDDARQRRHVAYRCSRHRRPACAAP